MAASSLIFSLLTVCILHSSAENNNPVLIDGPCPTPAPAPNFNATQLVGRWLNTYTTYAAVKTFKQRRCVQNFIELDSQDGSLYFSSTFKENNASEISIRRKKFVPVAGHPGKFTTQIPVDGNWQNLGWEYTFVAFEDDSFLEFGCRKYGDKHKEFHRIRSRTVPIPQSVVDKLLAIARAAGDERPALKYPQETCD